MKFESLSLSESLLKRLSELNFESATPIQQIAVPDVLAGKSVILRAETGSGKTAAYALPYLSRLTLKNTDKAVGALILTPTRELALQVQKELKNLAIYIPNLKISAFYGGHAFDAERKSLAHPPNILIATPGRLADHLRRDTLNLETAHYLVIDEADKLLEMGFEEELKFILKYLPFERQTIMISATFPPSLENLATSIFRKKPLRLEAGLKTVPAQIENLVIKTTEREKDTVLKKIIETNAGANAIIFCTTREKCRAVAQMLDEDNMTIGILHGKLEQADRDKIMAKFRNGSVKLLVATDIASRGIDIDKLDLVINYELPDKANIFLHRTGRTGRAGNKGMVYSMLTDREWHMLQSWEDLPPYRLVTLKDIAKATGNANPGKSADAKSTVHIHAGRKEKISKGDIVGALIAVAGLQSSEIGIIEIFDHFSYAAIPEPKAKKTLEKLNNGKIKGRKIKVSLVE